VITRQFYHRGVGNITVSVNSHQISEKVTALRALYQYSIHIPQFLWRYAHAIISSCAPVVAQLAPNDDVAMIAGSLMGECIDLFLYYSALSSPDAVTSANTMISMSLEGLLQGLQKLQLPESHTECVTQSSHSIVDSIRSILKFCFEYGNGGIGAASVLTIPKALSGSLLSTLQQEATVWVHRFVERAKKTTVASSDVEVDSIDNGELEDDLLRVLIDATGWLIKFCGKELDGLDSLVEVVLALMEVGSQTERKESSIVLFSMSILIDAIEFLPAIYADSLSQSVAATATSCLDLNPELTITCLYGLGVIAQYGSIDFVDSNIGAFLTILCSFACVPGLPKSSLLEIFEEEGEVESLTVVSLSALCKLALYRQKAIGEQQCHQLLLFVLENLPLSGDNAEAKSIHKCLLQLLEARDDRLLGVNPSQKMEKLPHIINFLCVIVSIDDTKVTTSRSAQIEFWEEQIVTIESLNLARTLLSNVLKSLSSDIVNTLLQQSPEEKKRILSSYLS
jgi:hypothetical protein